MLEANIVLSGAVCVDGSGFIIALRSYSVKGMENGENHQPDKN